MLTKKGDIWVSAVLYFALGVLILGIVLAATLPVIKQLKDKNVIVQTKNLMSDLDENIRSVYREGPGSQRSLEITINKGEFVINDDLNLVSFTMKSSFQESELGVEIQSGRLTILTNETSQQDLYEINLELDYSDILNLTSDVSQISGSNKILIKNKGGQEVPNIEITEI